MPAVTVKAVFELLNCAIWTADALEFVTETVRIAGVPTVTSPKSIAVGLICSETTVELVDENGLEFEPQPEKARLSAMVAKNKATALPEILPRNPLSVWVTRDRFVVKCSLNAKSKILRNSHIDITCAKKVSQPVRLTRGNKHVWCAG